MVVRNSLSVWNHAGLVLALRSPEWSTRGRDLPSTPDAVCAVTIASTGRFQSIRAVLATRPRTVCWMLFPFPSDAGGVGRPLVLDPALCDHVAFLAVPPRRRRARARGEIVDVLRRRRSAHCVAVMRARATETDGEYVYGGALCQ